MARVPAREFIAKNGKSVVVRTAEVNDAAALLAHVDLQLRDGEGMSASPGEISFTEQQEAELLQKYIDSPDEIFLVAVSGGKVVGSLNYWVAKRKMLKHSGEFGMGLHPDWRSQGVGSVLLETLVDWAKADPGREKITLRLLATNTRALNLYKKFGFEECGKFLRDVKFADGTYGDTLFMELFVN